MRVFATGRFSILKGWTLGGTLVYNNQNQRNSDKEKFKSYNIFQGMVYSFVSLPASFNLSLTGLYYSPMQIGNIHVLTYGKSLPDS